MDCSKAAPTHARSAANASDGGVDVRSANVGCTEWFERPQLARPGNWP